MSAEKVGSANQNALVSPDSNQYAVGKERRVDINERMWVFDKSESLALSGWLAQALNVRREINRLLLSEWEQVKSAQAASFSILRRYIGYWNAYHDLTDREAMGTHGGNYAEELLAAIIRGLVDHKFADKFDVKQNVWLPEINKEPDISIWGHSTKQLRAVVEVKTALDNRQWQDVGKQRDAYLAKNAALDFWLIALRGLSLSKAARDEIDDAQWACVLWNTGLPGPKLRENNIVMWKPVEPVLDALMQHLQGTIA